MNKHIRKTLKRARESAGSTDSEMEALAKFFMELHIENDTDYKAKYQEEEICTRTCPKCGSEMILKTRKVPNPNELFWGCKAFPNCNGSRSFDQTN